MSPSPKRQQPARVRLLSTDPEKPLTKRLEWVDAARGIGIILVVYGHALRAQVVSGRHEDYWHSLLQDKIIYSFHMPLFFLLAGLFVAQSIAKGPVTFVKSKAVTIAYPYLLWSTVSIVLGTIAAGATNYNMNLGSILQLWYKPVYQFWFLYVLFTCDMLALATMGRRYVAAVIVVLSATGLFAFLPGMFGLATAYLPFFFTGVVLSPYMARLSERIRVIVLTGALAAFMLFASVWLENAIIETLGRSVLRLIQGFSGIAMVVTLAAVVGRRMPWLALLGTASMAIYVMHTIFSAGLRMVLTMFAIGTPLTSLIMCTLIGIVGPLMIWAIARKLGLLPWFGLGTDVRRRQASPA